MPYFVHINRFRNLYESGLSHHFLVFSWGQLSQLVVLPCLNSHLSNLNDQAWTAWKEEEPTSFRSWFVSIQVFFKEPAFTESTIACVYRSFLHTVPLCMSQVELGAKEITCLNFVFEMVCEISKLATFPNCTMRTTLYHFWSAPHGRLLCVCWQQVSSRFPTL